MMLLILAALVFVFIFVALWILLKREGPRAWLESDKELIQAASSLIGVIAVAVAVLSAAASYALTSTAQRHATAQETRAAQVQAQAAATNALQEHLQLATDYAHLATVQQPQVIDSRYREPPYPDYKNPKEHPKKAKLEPEYSWFASHAMFAAETTYLLMQQERWPNKQEEVWRKTIEGLVLRHNTYVCHDVFPRGEYAKAFRTLIHDLKSSEDLCQKVNISRTT